MSLEEAFAPIEQVNRAIVINNTWGHLAPIPQQKYNGSILFCYGEYGDVTPIKTDFKNLPNSPWFFEDMNEFISDKCNELSYGNVYKFIGTYIKFKNGNYRFSGKINQLKGL
jgi:hypothetical protein